MANEITVRCSLSIRSGSLDYASRPSSFRADLVTTAPKGPTPGAITVSTGGTDVDLSQLEAPGFCWMQNLEPEGGNFVEWGIWEPVTSTFYPVGELLPGEVAVFRFSRNVLEEYAGTSSGTTGPTNAFRLKANVAACDVRIDVFER